MKNMSLKINRLKRSEQSGDWHDKPLRWEVLGPNDEVQKFPTKKESSQYVKIRRYSHNQALAISQFVRESV